MLILKDSKCINMANCTVFKRDGHMLYFDLIDHPTATPLRFANVDDAEEAMDTILKAFEDGDKTVAV